MGRAFVEKEGCSIPYVEEIVPETYAVGPCTVPDLPAEAFTISVSMDRDTAFSGITEPTPKGNGGSFVGFLVVGMITYTKTVSGPPSAHMYKARDCNGMFEITEWTAPANSFSRPGNVCVIPAASEYGSNGEGEDPDDAGWGEGSGDLCLIGYWCDTPTIVVWEKLQPNSLKTKFWGRIDSYESYGTDRYKYGFTEFVRTPSGFSSLPGGRYGYSSSPSGWALNSTEWNNPTSATKGNSVDEEGADFPEGFHLIPVRGQPILEITEEWCSSVMAYTFQYENLHDGSCP